MNEGYVELSLWHVAAAAALILINGVVSLTLRLKLEGSLLLASLRTVVQLLLIGLVLDSIFRFDRWYLVLALVMLMTLAAGFAAVRRVEWRWGGIWIDSLVSIWASSWIILAFALLIVVRPEHAWYQPRYSIPIMGMILGNTLTGISLGLGRLGEELSARRDRVETLLALGATRWEAAREAIQQAVRTGMIPIINSMMVVGIVSLPGMMTGQMISGATPLSAVKYQIAIMFLIASATALGTVGVVLLGYRRMFNRRHQFLYQMIIKRK